MRSSISIKYIKTLEFKGSILFIVAILFLSYQYLDIPIVKYINSSGYVNNIVFHILVYIPNIVTLIILIPTLYIILLKSSNKLSKIHMLLLNLFNSGIISSVVNNIVRYAIGRMDIKYGLVNNFAEQAYGFVPFSGFSGLPSGHSVLISVICTTMALFYPKQLLIWMFICLVVVISLLLTNSHYLTDCLTGIVIGYIVARTVYEYGAING